MREPTIFSRAVPMFLTWGDIHDIARAKLLGGISLFLVPTASGGHEQNLSAFVVNVPRVAATRLKSHVANDNTLC